MARSVTLGEIRTRAQQLADIGTDADGGSFVSSAEWSRYIDQAYCELYELMANSGLYYFESEQSITTTGAATVALPADHFQTIGVDYQRNNYWTPLHRIGVRERNRFPITGVAYAMAYRVVGTNLVLYGTPPSGQTYRHLYVPAPASLVDAADATTVDGVAGWEEYIVVDAAIRALLREDTDTSQLQARKAQLKQRIAEAAEQRETAAPARVFDINADDDAMNPYDSRYPLDGFSWRWR